MDLAVYRESACNRQMQNLGNVLPHPMWSKALRKSLSLSLQRTGHPLTKQRPPVVHKLQATK